MTRTLARVVDAEGKIYMPPGPSHMLIEDGKPVCTYTIDDMERLAMIGISKERDPQMVEDATERPTKVKY